MTTQYHFLVSCKKITDTEWTMETQADSGEVPLSIVHLDSETDEVLTTNPITRTIAEAKIMTHYLRQLNHHSGRGTVGHNDLVIRNISQRLSRLQFGQQITVKISYFEHKELRSGLYEINSLGVSPPVNRARPLIATLSQKQKARGPQMAADAITSLRNHVETLQQELHAAQKVLHKYGLQLEAQEKQIQQLAVENHQPKEEVASQPPSSVEEVDEDHIDTKAQSLFERKAQGKQIQQLAVENHQPKESRVSQTTPTQSSDSQPKEEVASQPPSSVEEVDEDHIDTKTQSLFQEFIKSSKFSKPQTTRQLSSKRSR